MLLVCFVWSSAGLVDVAADSSKESELSLSVERKIKRDAARLSLRALVAQNNHVSSQVEIPAALMDRFYKMLSSIYLENETARSLEKCNVHTFPNPSIDHLVVVYDRRASWTRPLQNGEKKSNSEAFEALLDRYHLKIENHVKWDDQQSAVTIRAAQPLNIAALAREFMKVEGVVKTELSIPQTKGNDIEARQVSDGWEITFLMKFGVHSSTGAKVHRWVYHCTDQGKVTFMEEAGAKVPDWLKCDM